MILSAWIELAFKPYRAFGITNLLRGGILGAAVYLSATAVPANGDVDHTASYTLRHVYKVDETARYKLTLHITGVAKHNIAASMTINETAANINADGSPVIAQQIQHVLGETDGSRHYIESLDTSNAVGAPIVPENSGKPPAGARIKAMVSIYTGIARSLSPAAPVHMGDTWKNELPADSSGFSSLQVTLADAETFHGAQALRLNIVGYPTASVFADGSEGKLEGAALINAGTSRLLAMTLKGAFVLNSAKGTIRIDLRLLPDKADPLIVPAATFANQNTLSKIGVRDDGDKGMAPVSLKPLFAVGDTDRYRVTIGVVIGSVPARSLSVSMTVADTVDRIDTDGLPIITENLEDISGVFNGKPQTFTSVPPVAPEAKTMPDGSATPKERYDPNKTSGFTQIAASFLGVSRSISPKAPVRVGDTWKVDFGKSTDPFSKAAITFTAIETNKGSQSARLDVIGDMNELDLAAGIKGQYRGSISLNPDSGKPMTLSMKGPMVVRKMMGTMRVDIRKLPSASSETKSPLLPMPPASNR